MANKRMLIDAAHPEETRVVVVNGTRLEEFDFESSTKKQVKGNIYLAKVTRVEPSLQAAFVDYGGNRHGFLAFSEIHPDYYRIPVGDRGAGEAASPVPNGHAEPEHDGDDAGVPLATALPEPVPVPEPSAAEDDAAVEEDPVSRATAEEELPRPPDDTRSSFDVWNGAQPEPAAFAPWEPQPANPEEAPTPETDAAPAHPSDFASAKAEHAPVHEAESTPFENVHEVSTGEGATTHAEMPVAGPELSDSSHKAGSGEAVRSAGAELAEPASELHDETEPKPRPTGYIEERSWNTEAWETETAREPDAIALRAAEDSVVAMEIGAFAPSESEAEGEPDGASESVEFLGGDEVEEVEEADAEQRRRAYPMRHYKIQEVIKRRQIMLVQVAKEERGNKGAALTTYLSLAGRYCVLMPNTNRGGGVSRKITSVADRRRLKDILEELEIPEGMGVIVRTAGAERSKAEIKRDYEYLLRLWNEIRDLTLKSTAPALIYEEGNLIKRSIRDLYTRDIDEVLVEGEEGYRTAKAFMRTLMPSHAKRVQPYRDPQIGLFHRFQIESQIDAIHSPVAQLRSGGYVVINQTEALVAIDVNSGRSTRERNIEETALRTNLEAAEEIARQLRLRDLAGLIVIDFIDMEEHRNQIAVERRVKDALKNDRARIQVGRISPFGLLEMSRQRLRPSLAEASTQPCPHCGGTGFIRSVESTALYVLRSIEEEGIRRRSAEVCIYVPTNVALYILNQKRESLTQIEARYGIRVMIARDDALVPPAFRLERLRAYGVGEAPPLRAIQAPALLDDEDEEEEQPEAAMPAEEAGAETESEDERARRRRRRRRRRPDEARPAREPRRAAPEVSETGDAEAEPRAAVAHPPRDGEEGERESEADRRRRRRGRRGGRPPRRREEAGHAAGLDQPAAETIEVVPADEDERIRREAETAPSPIAWESEAGFEIASLAPFAGEPVEPAEFEHEPVPSELGAEAAPEVRAESDHPPAFGFEREPEHPREPDREPEPPAPVAAEAEQGLPFVSESERVLEEAVLAAAPPADTAELPTPAPAHNPNEEVLTVTQKPINPRRGWWQRLTQG